MKNKILVYVLSLSLFVLPSRSEAIIPLLVQGAIELAPIAAEIAVGQFAAAGVARVINPTTSKTLDIPSGNRSLKVSFGLASAVAAAALFANFSGYTSASPVCSYVNVSLAGRNPIAKRYATFDEAVAALSGAFGGSLGSSVPNGSGKIYDWNASSGLLTQALFVGGCSFSPPVEDVAWLDLSTNPTQAKTDKLVSDLKAFAASNPAEFHQIASISDFPAQQPATDYVLASGTVSISSDGAGNTSVSGGSPALSLDSNNKILADGVSGTASAPPTSSPTPPSGTASATGSDMGAVVDAINNSKNQSVLDSQSIVAELKSTQTDCEKFPNAVGCKDLGTFNSTPHDFGDGITSSDSFASVYATHSAAWASSPLGSSITRLFPSTGVSGYPSWTINLLGTSLVLDFAQYASVFSSLGALVLVLAGFQSIKIILGRD